MVVPSQLPLGDNLAKDQTLKNHKQDKQLLVFGEGMPPVAVLFDWDNTLVDTWKTIFYAFNKTLVAFELEPWTEEFAIANMQHSGREAFPKVFGAQAKEAQKVFYKIFEEGNLQGLNPLPGAEALLEVLANKGIPTGVVSNKYAAMLQKDVLHLGWERYFGVLVGAGDAARDKPAPDPLLLALERLKIPVSSKVWMVGDAPVDWDCAIAAGCQPIAFGSRFEPPSSVLVSIENCGELKKIFAKM